MFFALGNDRPQILVQLEDHVLHAVIHISEGKATQDAIDTLYSQILSLQEGLASDLVASNWFNLSIPTPLLGIAACSTISLTSGYASIPSAVEYMGLPFDPPSDQDTAACDSFEDNFQG